MFHKEFYPTPDQVIADMLAGVDVKNKIILDPSAGAGNILNYISNGVQKYAYEIEPRLQNILKSDQHILLGNDFFKATSAEIAHIDLIIMNPPFSNGERHIRHAWDIAPSGCEIIALCNAATITNRHSWGREALKTLVETYGTFTELGPVFASAERMTDVNIGLIRLFKPVGAEFDYGIFFMDEEEEQEQGAGLMTYNEVRAVVNNYVACVKEFGKISDSISYINNIAENMELRRLSCSFGDREGFVSQTEFARLLQIQAWHRVFSRFNLTKYFTTKVNEKLNRMIANQTKVPFTMKNIYIMMDMIFQTRVQNLMEALVDAVDEYTRYTHENRYNVPGWKTNKGHMLNKKFIINNMVEENASGEMRMTYYSKTTNPMNDLIKTLCNITGNDYDNITYLGNWITPGMTSNNWYSVTTKDGKPIFFDFKFFKKGTMHLRFRDEQVWASLNRKYAEAKGVVLPEKI